MKSIIHCRENNTEFNDENECVTAENEDPCTRYGYPPLEKYSQLESTSIITVVGGRLVESDSSKNFKISVNELIAYNMNSEAKFIKVYTDGVKKCFLMPADFKDDAMRNFYSVKFKEFEELRA